MPFGAFAPLPLRLGGTAEEGWAPEQHARVCADLVAVRRTQPLTRFYFNGVANITSYWAQNSAGLIQIPQTVVNATGDYTFNFPAYWQDDYGQQAPIKLRQAVITTADTAARFPVYAIAGQGIRVRIFDAAGSAVDSAFTIRIWS